MLTTLAFAFVLLTPNSQDRAHLFVDRELSTLPDGIELVGPPMIDPNGKSYEVRSPVQWSPDGLQVAYVGYKGGKSYPVVGEHVEKSHDYVNRPVFGDNSEDVVFRVGDRASKTKEKWFLYRGPDTKSSKRYDWIGSPALAPDGSRVIGWNQPGAKISTGGYYARKNVQIEGAWKKGKKWEDAIMLTAPLFSADSKTAFSAALRGGTWSIVAFDKKGERELVKGLMSATELALHPKGKEVAFTTMVMPKAGSTPPTGAPSWMGSSEVQFDGKTYGEGFDASLTPVFSPDGKRLAYKVVADGKMGIAVDNEDEVKTDWDFVTRPVFSEDGKQVAFVANSGTTLADAFRTSRGADLQERGGKDQVIVLSVKALEKPDEIGAIADRIARLKFGPGKDQLAYAARTADGWRVHCGEFTSEPFDEVGELIFNDKGTVIGFGARLEREILWRTLKLEQ